LLDVCAFYQRLFHDLFGGSISAKVLDAPALAIRSLGLYTGKVFSYGDDEDYYPVRLKQPGQVTELFGSGGKP
jgi:hypothetical protein